jgi:hypothetical protein
MQRRTRPELPQSYNKLRSGKRNAHRVSISKPRSHVQLGNQQNSFAHDSVSSSCSSRTQEQQRFRENTWKRNGIPQRG